jgi:hypothetical protein
MNGKFTIRKLKTNMFYHGGNHIYFSMNAGFDGIVDCRSLAVMKACRPLLNVLRKIIVMLFYI